jgi:streptomycin 6-kinase
MPSEFLANLPERFKKNAVDVCGQTGEDWLKDLPQIIEKLSKKWSLKVEKPFPNLSYNYVAPCVCGDGRAVLKIALPLNNPEIYGEANFLKISAGRGTVKLLETDENTPAILLEKLTPGANLKEVFYHDKRQTVEIAINAMRRILKKPPPDSDFQTLENWFDNFFRKAPKTKFPPEYTGKVKQIFEELNTASKFLLHGDLHHENILSAEREPFLAIDPKGIIGSAGYEIAVFLNNHLWWLGRGRPNLKEELKMAVRQFSEAFEIEPAKLRKWAFCQIILSAWWTFEDNGEDWEPELVLAKIWEV